MENTQIKLSETVMVIDVAYLNFVINDLRKYFEPLLGRSFTNSGSGAFYHVSGYGCRIERE